MLSYMLYSFIVNIVNSSCFDLQGAALYGEDGLRLVHRSS